MAEVEEGGVRSSEGPDLGPAFRASPERQRAQAALWRRRRLTVSRPTARFTVHRRMAGTRR